MRTNTQPAAGRGTAKLRPKLLATLALTTLLVAAGTSESSATTANVLKLKLHFLECLEWMFTDPAMHERLCSPNVIPMSLETMATTGTSKPVPEIVVPIIIEYCEWKYES